MIRLTLTDKFQSVVSQAVISTAKVLLDLYQDTGVGIGKLYETGRGALDVGGHIYTNANLYVQGNSYFTGPATFTQGITPITIPANTNLNTYMTPNMYYCSANSTAATIANVPLPQAFSLLVEKHAGFKQTWTEYKPLEPSTWTRNYYNGTWGAWRKIGYLIDSYPIGSIYESTVSTNPALLFGGTWERFGNGQVTVGLAEGDADFGTVLKTGGAKSYILKALIGAVDGRVARVGYVPSTPIRTSYSTGMWSEGGSSYTGGIGTVNHNVEVRTWNSDSSKNDKEPQALQPYITVYRWRRIA